MFGSKELILNPNLLKIYIILKLVMSKILSITVGTQIVAQTQIE